MMKVKKKKEQKLKNVIKRKKQKMMKVKKKKEQKLKNVIKRKK